MGKSLLMVLLNFILGVIVQFVLLHLMDKGFNLPLEALLEGLLRLLNVITSDKKVVPLLQIKILVPGPVTVLKGKLNIVIGFSARHVDIIRRVPHQLLDLVVVSVGGHQEEGGGGLAEQGLSRSVGLQHGRGIVRGVLWLAEHLHELPLHGGVGVAGDALHVLEKTIPPVDTVLEMADGLGDDLIVHVMVLLQRVLHEAVALQVLLSRRELAP